MSLRQFCVNMSRIAGRHAYLTGATLVEKLNFVLNVDSAENVCGQCHADETCHVRMLHK